ncbi:MULTISPECIES: apolipoprotein N-acyltransferase [unclassified Pseudomonas]|uniref:apolipoprotein N-acyltransferase n=1 Tax=unclassified Pseudomonas TaxID=196821 RepID=UPI00131BC772|nr:MULTISPECIES: apolipoprotein N-acyltransferase [unclassified Pseudomonas]
MRWISQPGWKGNLLALFAGALTPLALAPFNIWPLALLSAGLFYLGLKGLGAWRALLRGWCYGFGAFLAGTSWIYVSIHTYGAAPVPLALFLTVGFCAGIALFFALPAGLWALCLRRNQAPLGDALTFAGLWFALELFRSWALTGFPWLLLGYSQLSGPLQGLAPLGGVWLISAALAFTAALLVNAPRLIMRPLALVASLVLVALPWVAGDVFKGQVWTQPAGAPLKVAGVQGNIAQELKWNPDHARATLALYRDRTAEQGDADLVVWPENAIPVLREYVGDFLAAEGAQVAAHGGALVTGLPARERDADGDSRYFNSITAVGNGSGTYYKQKLVPFGEYVPLQEYLRGLIGFFDLPMSDFVRGPEQQEPLLVKGYRVAPYICYEVVYPEFVASMAARSQLLLTISNDTWFGKSIGPQQHLQMAQMRALESGRWLVRVTNDGITALVDPFGRISRQIPAFEVGVLQGSVVPMDGLTPYLHYRLWPLAIFSALVLLWGLLLRRQDRPEEAPLVVTQS